MWAWSYHLRYSTNRENRLYKKKRWQLGRTQLAKKPDFSFLGLPSAFLQNHKVNRIKETQKPLQHIKANFRKLSQFIWKLKNPYELAVYKQTTLESQHHISGKTDALVSKFNTEFQSLSFEQFYWSQQPYFTHRQTCLCLVLAGATGCVLSTCFLPPMLAGLKWAARARINCIIVFTFPATISERIHNQNVKNTAECIVLSLPTESSDSIN